MIRRFPRSLVASDPNPSYSRLDRLDGLTPIIQPASVPPAVARIIPVSSPAGIQSWINHHKES